MRNLDLIEHYERSGQQYWLRWAFIFRIQVIVIYQLHWFWPFMITFRIHFHYFDIYFSYLIHIFPYIYVKKFSIGTNGEVVNKMFFLP
jgi:hypothetical protein